MAKRDQKPPKETKATKKASSKQSKRSAKKAALSATSSLSPLQPAVPHESFIIVPSPAELDCLSRSSSEQTVSSSDDRTTSPETTKPDGVALSDSSELPSVCINPALNLPFSSGAELLKNVLRVVKSALKQP